MTRNTPDSNDDMIDARDLLDRLEELRDERNALQEELAEAADGTATLVDAAQHALAQWDEDNGEELDALAAIENEISRDQMLIRDSYFKDYAQEQAEDIHSRDSLSAWPFNCIDWDQAASELQHDYHSVEFDGVTYWVAP